MDDQEGYWDEEDYCQECGRSLDVVYDYITTDEGYLCTTCEDGDIWIGDGDI